MSDLNNDVRLAVDTGDVSLGHRDTLRAIHGNTAKAIVIAESGKRSMLDDINHLSKIAGVRIIIFKGGSMELGEICGKPYSINSLAVISPGNSKILDEEYN